MKTRWGWMPLLSVAVALGPTVVAAQALRPISSASLRSLQAREQSRAQAAVESLRSSRGALKLDPASDFVIRRATTDVFGQTHTRVQQTYRGVPVWGATAIAHTDSNGRALPLTNALIPGVNVGVSPRLSPSDALGAATRVLKPKGNFAYPPTTALVVYPRYATLIPQGLAHPNALQVKRVVTGFTLAYHVHTVLENRLDGTRHTDFMVDAANGRILKQWSTLQTDAPAVGTGHSQYNAGPNGDHVVTLDTTQLADGTFELHDTLRGMGGANFNYGNTGNVVIDLDHAADSVGDGYGDATGPVYSDADNDWGDGLDFDPSGSTSSVNGQTAAVDAAFGISRTWDFYQGIFGRDGIDGAGTATYSRVHYRNGFDNAFWSDNCFCMTFGDGSGPGNGGFSSLEELDVTGHELTHGVTSNTAGLDYQDESGGLNEATSDIMGTMVEFWVANGQGASIGNMGGNWTIGEQLSSSPLRWMYKPSKDGASADAWSPDLAAMDPHFSSGPGNRVFYFLSQGASADASSDYYSAYLPAGMGGIGNDHAAAIWYRALSVYMTPSETYAQARSAALLAARDLYSSVSPEYDAVQNAFAAINVGFPAGSVNDTVPPVVGSVTATVNGNTVTLTADATDNIGVKEVQFFVGSTSNFDDSPTYVGSATSAPFTMTMSTGDLADGTNYVFAVATDNSELVSDPASGSFSVTHDFTQLVVNPGFEEVDVGGVPTGWTDPNGVILYADDGSWAQYARSGNGLAAIGYNTGTDQISQTVTVPAEATSASLRFWVLWSSYFQPDPDYVDTLSVVVTDTADSTSTTVSAIDDFSDATWLSGDYKQFSVDLTGYAGKTIDIALVGDTDPNYAVFQIDDTSLRVYTTPDTTPPTVTAHEGGSTGDLTLSADAEDDRGIASVDFKVDGTSVGTVTAPPFTISIAASSLANGAHTLVATAADVAGNTVDSAPVAFAVDTSFTQVIKNPGFEEGPALWTASTGYIIYQGGFPHSGDYVGWLGGYDTPHTDSLSQLITIPASGVQALSFYMLIGTAETDGTVHDTLKVELRDPTGTQVLAELGTFSNTDPSVSATDFKHPSFDVSAFAGQTVMLYLESNTDEGNNTNFFVDDFSLTATTTPVAPVVTASVQGSGGVITFGATIDSELQITGVDFLVDGNVVSSVSPSGLSASASFDSTALADGTHTLTAQAHNNMGQTGTSAPVSFQTSNPYGSDKDPPELSLSVNETCGDVVIHASATDASGVASYDLYVDGKYVTGVQTATADFSLAALLPTVGLSLPGSHGVRVIAADLLGHQAVQEAAFSYNPNLSVSPGTGLLLAGQTLQLTATVCGVDTVTWSVQEAGGGSVDSTGLYTAPSASGTYHVLATGVTDPTNVGSATIRVYNPDVDGSGALDVFDLGVISAAHGSNSSDAAFNAAVDLDGNGKVDDADVSLFLTNFGN